MKKILAISGALLMFAAMPAIAGVQDFSVVNDTGYDIYEVYVSPTRANDWQEDVLAEDILANGGTTDISFARNEDSCMWDLKVVYEDDDTAAWKAINLCEVSEVTLEYDADTGRTWATTD